MMPKLLKTGFIALIGIFILSPFSFAATTGNSSRDMVLTEALDQVQQKTDAVTEATPEYEPKVFRQKLSTAVVAEEKEEAPRSEFDSYVRYMPTRSLASQPGKISIIKSAAEYSYNFKAFGKLPIQLGIGAEDININASDAVPVSLPAHLTSFTFGAEATLPFFTLEKTYLRLGIMPSFNSTNWNFKANSFNFGSRAMVIYQPSDKLTFVLGLSSEPGFENPLMPFGGIIYEPNDRLTFNLVPSRPTISFDLTKHITAFWEGGMSGGEFKVTKDNFNGAALDYSEMHTGLGLQIRPNENIDASISFGRTFNQSLEYRDSLGKVNIKNGFYSEFRVEARI
ncbi:MAG: transporter [Candidatus Omnitrophica bacterium]|nr:transporter [Candidatus Omnitrophota bacterium]